MEENIPTNMPKKANPVLWIVLVVVVVIIIGAVLFFGDYFNPNTNSNTNTVANINVATNTNTNTVVNSNTNSNTNTNPTTNTNSNTNTNSLVDTSDWKTFSGDSSEFTIDYPSDGAITSNSIYDPIISTGISGCTFNYNGQGLGRGTSFTPIADTYITLGNESYVAKQYQCESDNLCLQTILLQNQIAVIELGFPDSDLNDLCNETLGTMLNTYSSTL